MDRFTSCPCIAIIYQYDELLEEKISSLLVVMLYGPHRKVNCKRKYINLYEHKSGLRSPINQRNGKNFYLGA